MATRKPLVLIAGAVQELPTGDDLGFTPENVAAKDASGGYPGLTLLKINLRNAANTITSWFTTAATAARTWTMPDKSGTVALTSDIHDATSKTTPVDADELGLVDSAASNVLKKLTWANLKTTLATWINGGTLAGSFTTLNASGATTLPGGALITGASLLGYGTGAGGTVTQATSKSAGVTLHKPCGQITTHNAALAAGDSVIFILANNLIAAYGSRCDVVVATVVDDFGAVYIVTPVASWGGYVALRLTNISAGSLSQAVRINFQVLSGAIA